jgi:hypothetical protein
MTLKQTILTDLLCDNPACDATVHLGAGLDESAVLPEVPGWVTVAERDGDLDFCSKRCARLAQLSARIPA